MFFLSDITSICSDPALARPLSTVHQIFEILCILIPIVLVIFATTSLVGLLANPDKKKGLLSLFLKFFAALVIFFVPNMINIIMSWVAISNDDETSKVFQISYCWQLAEETKSGIEDATYMDGAGTSGGEGLLSLFGDLSGLKIYVKKETSTGGASNGSNTGDNSGSSSGGTANTCGAGQVTSNQPDPAIAINYWASRGNIDAKNFIYPRDTGTGYSLGAHPKGFSYQNLGNVKTYQSGAISWPVTPENGVYKTVYEHNGMDILSPIGTPVYSPVDGVMRYSEWGHTVNKGCDETAYTVTIKLNTPFSFGGKSITHVFLTHMSGLVYYCPDGSCSRSVKKGELLGFVGNAAGDASDVGSYAPHLHITYYASDYNNGLGTGSTEKLYGISNGVARKAGE